ncbi:phosphomannomutase/phosphoglucomutase [uncultured Paludibaculum sp.]|uniref:phosphomannomutase/phosphoglucomutase n=1 Tax=uncultured Paludibaculum sp. TaxID=1765020 RepID=UPI002AAB4797|nr:phosphomannomutase/phosphoglucomutase [uncultured Paludibaculum sp.]
MLKQTIFREYDIRGIADVELLSPDIVGLGRALGTFLLRNGATRVNVGRDVRLSGQRLRDALVEGLLSTGCQVTDLGQVPTPVLYYSVQHLGSEAGVMITGSHNPSEYNGFKTMLGKGTIYGAQIQEVYRILKDEDFLAGEGTLSTADVITPYVEEIPKQFPFSRRVKVVFDAGNGVAGPTMHRLLEKLDIEATEMFFEPDGRFPNHHPDPTVEHNLDLLKAEVARQGAELGIAFDGDSDRIGAVDEKGTVIWGDMLMLIYGREILTRKPGATFIGEVKCSQVMYDELNRLGANAIMYKTGHSLIKAKMKQEHAELAGEMSGHMFFADRYYGYDDALYAACRLIEIVADSGRPLSAQTEGLPKMVFTPELRVDCPDELKFQVVDRVKAHFQAIRPTVDVDGVRVLFDEGWGLVRGSNTQPILVLRFEARSQEKLDEYRKTVETVVEEAKAAVGA